MECDDFIPSSDGSTSSSMGKGILIHIVEDSSILTPRPSQHGQSAVLINLPSTNAIESHDEVFSSAQVSVSMQYLAYIPEDRNIFFTNLCSSLELNELKFNNDNTTVTFQGTWSQILQAQDTMRAYLTSWKQQQQLISDAYDALDVKEEVQLNTFAKPAPVAYTTMRTRRQQKLQRDKEQVGPQAELEVKIEATQPPPRDNKENEVHLSISLANNDSQSIDDPDDVISASSNSNCPYIQHRLKKKNYEQCTPFKFFCNMCSFKTKRESHYNVHIKKHQNASNVYSCDSCSFTTIRLGHLRRHELTHSTSTLKCTKCCYETDEERHLLRHQRMKHDSKEEEEKPVVLLSCKKCTYSTTKPHLFERHRKKHQTDFNKSNSLSFQCEQCPYKAYRKEHYLRHVNNVHQNSRPYLCDLCGKAFKRPDALKQHAVTHADLYPNVKVYRCAYCNKGCRSQAHLKEHLSVHSNVRAFLCEVCGLSFKTRSVQRKHVATIHKNPQAFSCNKCLKKFNTKYALRRHMKQHSWKEDEAENDDSFPHALVIQSTEETNKSDTLTVHISDEILATLPSGTVPIFLSTADKKCADDSKPLALLLPQKCDPENATIQTDSQQFLNSKLVIVQTSEVQNTNLQNKCSDETPNQELQKLLTEESGSNVQLIQTETIHISSQQFVLLEKEGNEDTVAAEALSLQLRQLRECDTRNPSENSSSTSQQFLNNSTDSNTNLLYVSPTYEQF